MPPEVVRDAFRELHGARLHGFALLLALGDRSLAARLAADALAAADRRTHELRHPERAAAWLRTHVVRAFPRRAMAPPRVERHRGLDALEVDEAVAAGLAALSPRERAAVVASVVERLDRHDVEAIVGRDGTALDRLLARARRRYLSAYAYAAPPGVGSDGTVVARMRAIATRTLQ